MGRVQHEDSNNPQELKRPPRSGETLGGNKEDPQDSQALIWTLQSPNPVGPQVLMKTLGMAPLTYGVQLAVL
jgi:hypothetical protein